MSRPSADTNERMQRSTIWPAMALSALAFSTTVIQAAVGAGPHVGDAYEITLTRHSDEQGADGSSGSSDDRDTVIERVIAVRADGLDLEYDFPKDTPKEERDSNWQLPARVFRPFHGPTQLLDRPAVERRIDAWLKAAKWPRSICGHWIFTWNAFQIDCDPESVVKTVQAYELDSDLREGALYQDSHARGPGILKKTSVPEGMKLSAEMEIDPDSVRREQAESDVALGEINKKPVSFETALKNHEKDTISGTITVTFDADSQGNAWRRTRLTKLAMKTVGGKSTSETITETLERRIILHP